MITYRLPRINFSFNGVINTLAGGIAALALLFALGLLVLVAIGRLILFKKCNVPWWKAIIPFYSDYVFFVEVCSLHWAWYLAFFFLRITFIPIFINAIAFYNLAKKTNKDPIPSMIFGGVFPSIVTVIYGLTIKEFNPDTEVKQSGIF